MGNEDFADELISDDDARGTARRGRGVALVAAGLVAGGALAAGATAFATSSSSSSPSDSSGTSSTAASGQPSQGAPGKAGGAASVRSDEKQLTGTDADKAKAAALKAVPGGTVYRVETDAGDAAYEAHMKKADGTLVTVKLDKNFVVTKVEAGMGLGDPRPAGGRGHGDNDGDGPGGNPPNGTNPEHA